MVHCSFCSVELPSVNAIFLHQKLRHADHPKSHYPCREPGCNRQYGKWCEFRRHLQNYHNFPPNVQAEGVMPTKISDTFDFSDDISGSNGDIHSDEMNKLDLDKVKSLVEKMYFAFIGKLYAAPNLPRNHVQTVFEDTKELLKEVFSILCGSLDLYGSEHIKKTDLNSVCESILDPLGKYSTEYRRVKKLSETGCLIKPRSYIVGSAVQEKLVQNVIVKELVPLTGQYIPLAKTLESFFSLPGVLQNVMLYMQSLESQPSNILSNFTQGFLWRSKKERYFKNKITVPLFFFYDDFECNNPLGSHAGVQKLGGTYYFIPCLPPEYQSTLDNIFVALLTHASDRHESEISLCKNDEIFGILINQINYLQEHGISVKNGNAADTTIYFAFGLLLGDNEGLNSTQDFTEGANANHYCRTCYVHRNEARSDQHEKPELLRTKDQYQTDLSKASKQSGLKGPSVWNKIDGHHIYENYVCDILHDLEEGVFKYDMQKIVYHCMYQAKKKVSLTVLNDRIKTFNYHVNCISNKPPLISHRDMDEKRLKMSGSEMRNFVFIFSMLVGDLVDYDEVWYFYLILRRILDIVYARSLQIECSVLLDALVAEHHRLYLKLFSDNLKPKHHNMVHYGRILRMSGPLISLSSIRPEAKHRINKVRAHATYCRKNITYTLALKEQLEYCYRVVSGRGFYPRLEMGPASLPSYHVTVELELPLSFRGCCVEVNWVKYKGTKYITGSCVVIDTDKNNCLPVFGIIQSIYYNDNSKVCLLCRKQECYGKIEMLHAYAIRNDVCDEVFVMLDDILYPQPVILARLSDGELYATVRHNL